jgi:hypothetical protein
VVVEAVTVGMLGVRAACGETREQQNAWKEKRDQCKCCDEKRSSRDSKRLLSDVSRVVDWSSSRRAFVQDWRSKAEA